MNWLKVGGYVAAMAAVAGVLIVTYNAGNRAGRSGVLQELAENRVTILQDGREIDADILKAAAESDDALCTRLPGGCGGVQDNGSD